MIRVGIVTEKKGEKLTLLFDRPEACEHCGQREGCAKQQSLLSIPGKAEIGDRVEVFLPEGRVAQAALLAYVLPLIFLMAGLFLAEPLRAALALSLPGDLLAVLCGLLGLLLGFGLMRLIMRRTKAQRHFQPELLRVLPKDTCKNEV